MRWQVVIPQKPLAEAKSRLPDGVSSPALAEAMLRDVIAACVGTGLPVHLLGDERLPSFGVSRLADVGGGLSVAVMAAAAEFSGPVAIVMADLPCLRSDDLAAALELAAAVPLGVVADAAGTGTTMLTALSAPELRPSYGMGSLHRHGAAGAVSLGADLPRLRRDVDTWADLHAAVALGVGPATAQALDDLELDAVHSDGP